MKRTSLVLAIAALALWQLPGCNCGATPATGPGDGGPIITAQTVCSDLATRACDFFIRCHSEATVGYDFGEGRAEVFGITNDEVASSERARCVAKIADSPNCLLFSASIDAGRMAFDSSGYTACMGLLYPSGTCARDVNGIIASDCQTLPFLVGEQDAGAACATDRECQAGFCTATGPTSCGSCQPPRDAGTGAPCTRDSQCDRAFEFCPGSDGTAGNCTPYHTLGATCGNIAADPDQEQCGPGNVCANQSASLLSPNFRCQVAKTLGQPCTLNKYECLRGAKSLPRLVCAPAALPDGGIQNQCVPLQAPSGGACGDGDSIPFVNVSFPICSEAEYCASNTCTARLALGGTCTADRQCQQGLHCVGTGGSGSTCQPFVDLDGGCGASTDCKNLLQCAGGTVCAPELALPTEPCNGRTCVDSYCDSSTTTCAALKGSGVSCGSGAECTSGVCSTTCQAFCE